MDAHVIHCLSWDTTARLGRRTLLAPLTLPSSSQAGSGTRKKSTSLPCSLYSRRRSRSCSAKDSFCTSCSMKSALATTAYQGPCALASEPSSAQQPAHRQQLSPAALLVQTSGAVLPWRQPAAGSAYVVQSSVLPAVAQIARIPAGSEEDMARSSG